MPWKRVHGTLGHCQRLAEPLENELIPVLAEVQSVVTQKAPPAAISFIGQHITIEVDKDEAFTPGPRKLHLSRFDYAACSVSIWLDAGAGPLVNIVRCRSGISEPPNLEHKTMPCVAICRRR